MKYTPYLKKDYLSSLLFLKKCESLFLLFSTLILEVIYHPLSCRRLNSQYLSALEALCDYVLYKSTFTLHYIYIPWL